MGDGGPGGPGGPLIPAGPGPPSGPKTSPDGPGGPAGHLLLARHTEKVHLNENLEKKLDRINVFMSNANESLHTALLARLPLLPKDSGYAGAGRKRCSRRVGTDFEHDFP
uniref:Uncharacterized protein n=1 Tax=Romanomermis culicivorax TaxID=13658 RepID=A0A915HHI5_ROMCU